jgi:hypothetical protein
MATRKSGKDKIAEAQAAFNRAPMRENRDAVLARRPGTRIGPTIPASRGVQTMGVNQSTAMTVAPRSALDQASGLMTSRQTERLAGRVRDSFAMQPSRPTVLDSTPKPQLQIPQLRERSLPVPFLDGEGVPRGASSAASAAPRAPRRGPRGRGVAGALTNVLGAYALGAGAATPSAIQAEVAQRRRAKETR